jgi:hypothetical protein
LKGTLKSKNLEIKIKGKLYDTPLKPVLTYGSESWTLAKGNEQNLKTFERKVLGKI